MKPAHQVRPIAQGYRHHARTVKGHLVIPTMLGVVACLLASADVYWVSLAVYAGSPALWDFKLFAARMWQLSSLMLPIYALIMAAMHRVKLKAVIGAATAAVKNQL
jgi:hypothetical protein